VSSPGVGSTSAPRAQAAAAAPEPPPSAPAAQSAAERPEVLVGAAFAGAFLLARLIRAATSSDD
jgi:hypothetical protein